MDGSYQLLAARYIRKQTRQLVGQLDGAHKADDIEYVHQARVASRRLRAGLRVFPDCFSRKKVKRWRKEIRRLTEGLGPARDKDVQIEFVRGVLLELDHDQKAQRPGIARFLLRLEQGRRAIQPAVIEAVDRFEASGVGPQMLAAAEKMRSKLKKRHVSLQSPFVFSQAREHIGDRLNELMGYEDCLGDPQDQEHHHAMRIAAKRLRYTLEICQPAYEGRLDPFVKAVKNLQTLLGDIHDCDVWVAHLDRFLDEERQRTITYYGNARPFRTLKVGLDFLQQERRSHRQERFGELVCYWQELDHEGLWERLVETVESPDEPSGGRQRPTAAQPSENGGQRSVGRPGGDGQPAGEDRIHQAPQGATSGPAEPSVVPAASGGRKAGQQTTLLGTGGPGSHGQ